MGKRAVFRIVYDVEVENHLRAIETKYHSAIRRTIEQQLTYQADVRTRNRKPLIREVEMGATWELRFGPGNRFRVFYAVDRSAHEVQILAIGVKQGNRLFIADEEINL